MFVVVLAEQGDQEDVKTAVEVHAVMVVDLGPRPPAAPDLLHHRLVERAPGVGELRPVHPVDVLATGQRFAFARDAPAPVHHRSEHVERQRLDLIEHDYLLGSPRDGWDLMVAGTAARSGRSGRTTSNSQARLATGRSARTTT